MTLIFVDTRITSVIHRVSIAQALLVRFVVDVVDLLLYNKLEFEHESIINVGG